MRKWSCLGMLLMVGGNLTPLTADDPPEPLEPTISESSDEGRQAMEGYRLPKNWQISLFAAEPDVANIVAFDVDNQGRVWVCESFRQNRGVTDNRGHDETWLKRDLAAQTVQDRIDYHLELLGDQATTYTEQDDRIRLLIDSDSDGVADQATVFADHFNRLEDGTGAGVLARGNEVYFTNIPKLYKLVDADADGVADERVVMSDGYGVRVAFRGHDMHGLVIGPDGRLYFSIGDRGYHVMTQEGKLLHDPASGAVFRCELDGSNLEVFAKGLRNPQELAFNDYGDLFSGDNNSDSGDQARLVHILQGSDAGWRMYYQYLPDRGPFNRDRIWEPLHDTQPAYIVPPIRNFGDGPSGFTFYPGTGFGDELADMFLMCDFRGTASNSGIRTVRLEADGAFYTAVEDAESIWSVLATDVTFGPDGAIYISDWVNGWDGIGKGRIYRITHTEHQQSEIVAEVKSLLAGDWTAMSVSRLANLLTHPDRRVRFESQWELARRDAREAFQTIAADTSVDTKSRLHALWGLEQCVRRSNSEDPKSQALVVELLDDSDEYVRAQAAQFIGEHPEYGATDTLVGLVADESSRVRYFATRALGNAAQANAMEAIVLMLAENDNRDPALRHAGAIALSQLATSEQIAELSNHSSASVRRAAVVSLRHQGAAEVASFLTDGDERVIAEAARAIHDLPIPTAMPALARLIDRPTDNIAIAHRALNANFRIGGEESAMALARYAARASAPAMMRREALSMLGDWANPDERDRVLNDWRPLDARDGADAKQALSQQLAGVLTGSEEIRNQAISLAADLGITQIAPMLKERLGNPELAAQSRAAALTAMIKLEPDTALAAAAEILNGKPVDNALVVAAIGAAAELAPKTMVDQIISATQPQRSMLERQAAWDALASIDSDKATQAIQSGIAEWMDGDVPADSALNLVEAARALANPELSAKIEDFTNKQAESNPLAKWSLSLAGGNTLRGESIFLTKTELSCVRCHKVGPQGGEVGPNLTVIGKEKDAKYLLESIVAPDAQIAKGYETTVIADDLGVTYIGIVRSENDEYIDLVKADGSQTRIYKDTIIARKRGQSAMPNDLIKYMTERELRDLVAYLSSLKEEYVSEEGGHQVE